jgi:glycosyltransferase involved in cell wall biosynthesis
LSRIQKLPESNAWRHRSPSAKLLRVLFFSHSAQLAGAERGLLELVAQLIKDYKAVCSVVCPGDGPLVSKFQSVGASTIIESRLGWWAGIGAENATRDNLSAGVRALLKILPTLQDIDPDVVYTQTITIPWGACAAALLDKPHYWSICEFGELDHGLRFFNGLADALEQVKSGASFIRTPSDAVRATLFPDLGPDRVRTVYRPGPMPTAITPSNEHFQRPGATRLAVFGTISEGKGQIDAVSAAADLIARGRDVELLLAGYSNPEYRTKVEALIDARGVRDRVRISDFLPEPYSTMLAADIILVCSRNEAFGRVVVEAMQLGRPVVYSRSGGIPEYMKDGVVGLSYSSGDANELVQRIEELLDDPERAERIGAEAKRYACMKFTRNDNDFRILKGLKERRGCTDWRVAMPRDVVASLSAVILGAEQGLMNAQNQLNSMRQKYEATDAALREQLRSMQSKEAELQQIQRLLANRETELNETQRLLAGRETELNETQRLLARKATKLGKAQRLLARRENQLTEIFRSTSWRLTTPLRKLASLTYRSKRKGSRIASGSNSRSVATRR